LLFDEATSHLDTATERAIQEGLRTSLSGRTVVLVAHRLSTIKEADSIYVLHQGRVVEEGTHWQLVARQGRYWSLWRSQAHDGTGPHCSPAAAGRNGIVHTEKISHA
jgi:ABC-type multidrug transport system fused ATPase/permease subunit